MTARAFPFDNEFLSRCSTRIINEVHGGKYLADSAGELPANEISVPCSV